MIEAVTEKLTRMIEAVTEKLRGQAAYVQW